MLTSLAQIHRVIKTINVPVSQTKSHGTGRFIPEELQWENWGKSRVADIATQFCWNEYSYSGDVYQTRAERGNYNWVVVSFLTVSFGRKFFCGLVEPQAVGVFILCNHFPCSYFSVVTQYFPVLFLVSIKTILPLHPSSVLFDLFFRGLFCDFILFYQDKWDTTPCSNTLSCQPSLFQHNPFKPLTCNPFLVLQSTCLPQLNSVFKEVPSIARRSCC